MALKFKYEVSKELSDKALEALEIARSSGKIKKGTNEVTKAIERGITKLVFVAQDVSPEEVVMHLPILCEEKNVVCIPVGSKTELGTAVGLEVGTASAAIIGEGDGKDLVKEIIGKIKGKEKKE